MTPREFKLTLQGKRRKAERWLEMLAWHAANVINHRTPAFGEKRRRLITPADLLGKGGGEVAGQFSSPEEFKEYLRRRSEAV